MFSVFSDSSKTVDQNCMVLGAYKKARIGKEHLLAVNRFLCCRGQDMIKEGAIVEVFFRVSVGGSLYTCLHYTRSKVKNSYTIEYLHANGTTMFGKVVHYVKIASYHFAIINKLQETGRAITADATTQIVELKNSSNNLGHHVVEVRSTQLFTCIPLTDIKQKCLFIQVSAGANVYLSRFPNTVERD